MLNFPGASSRQLLYYMAIHLEGIQVDTFVIHIGINVLLNYSNQSRIDSLMNNIICMVEKCCIYGVKNTFLSGIVFTTRVSLDILIQVDNMISNFCNTSGLYYIDNRNIRADSLYKDGLHLLADMRVLRGSARIPWMAWKILFKKYFHWNCLKIYLIFNRGVGLSMIKHETIFSGICLFYSNDVYIDNVISIYFLFIFLNIFER